MTRIANRLSALVLVAFLVGSGFAPVSARPATEDPAPVSAARAYRLGSGDRLQITTFGEPSLSGVFNVAGSGMVAVPLIGEVKAAGLTSVEFGRAVETALRDGFLKEPRVSVEVVNYRPFYILGEVNRPGEYPYSSGLTVMNAVATANGFTYRADTHHIFIKRPAEQTERRTELTASTPVEPGDTIRIKERYF